MTMEAPITNKKPLVISSPLVHHHDHEQIIDIKKPMSDHGDWFLIGEINLGEFTGKNGENI